MTFSTSIQEFPGTASLGSGANQAIPDWADDTCYIVDNGSGDLRSFAMSSGSALVVHAFTGVAPSFTLDDDNFLYFQKSAANYNGQFRYQGSTLTQFSQWGTPSATVGPPDAVLLPSLISAVKVQNVNWIVGISGGLDYRIWAVKGSQPAFGGLDHAYDETGGITCPGGTTSMYGEVWAMGYPAFGGPDVYGLYQVRIGSSAAIYDPSTWPTVNPGIGFTKLATIHPADIDAAWTTVSKPAMFYDATDGNLIVWASTPDVVPNKFYLVKLSTTDGSIIWKTAVDAFPGSGNNEPQFSRVRYGTYCYVATMSLVPTLFTCDTTTGVVTTTTTGFLGVSAGPQCFDDTTGVIFLNTDYTAGVGHPTPRGSTPNNFSNQWAALYAVEAFVPPYIPGGTQTWTQAWGRYI